MGSSLVRGVLSLIALAGALVVAAPTAGARSTDSSNWIVVLEPGLDVAARADGLARDAGGRAGLVFDDVLEGFAFTGSQTAAGALERNPLVRAVVVDGTVELADVAGLGFFRIDAEQSIGAAGGSYRGAGTRVAVIDSGVDLDHPDLAPNLDLANSLNCVTPGASVADDNSHGSHVTGIAAGALDGAGMVGIAPDASILALKAFDATGYASDSEIICAMDQLAGVVQAEPMPTVLNMSFVDVGTNTACDDADVTDVLHEAICNLDDLGVVMVAGAGNSTQNVATAVPAIFDETITVSALADFDGAAGGLAGCNFDLFDYGYDCDDTLASFSNYGAGVDVVAPGVHIYSTVPGGLGYKSGTSMAAPHVAGVVALMLGVDPTLDRLEVLDILQSTGECPNGTVSGTPGACAGAGNWTDDPDGSAEPLVNAMRAASAADNGAPTSSDPIASFSETCTALDCTFTDTSTDPGGSIVSWAWDFADGSQSTAANPLHSFAVAGTYLVELTVTDNDGATDTTAHEVTVTTTPPANIAPTADAGVDRSVPDTKKKGVENVGLDGSGSSDPDGTLVSYAWTDSAGTVIATGATPTVSLGIGATEITVTVTDDDGATDTDTVVITVGEAPPTSDNITPSADAGPDQTIYALGAESVATLDGSGSTDTDGTVVSHVWSDASGNTLGAGASIDVSLPLGIHEVTLTVTDDDGATDTDIVVVTVDLAFVVGHTHVESLTVTSSSSGKGKWSASVEVYVMWEEQESAGTPVGADPSTVTLSTSTGETLECTTVNQPGDADDGRCTVTLSNIPRKINSVTFTVIDVWTPGFIYTPNHPHQTSSIDVVS